MGTPGRISALNLRVRSAALYTLSYGSKEAEAERAAPRMRGLFCLQIASNNSTQSLLRQTVELLLTIVAAAPMTTPQELGEFSLSLWVRQNGFDITKPGFGSRIANRQFVNKFRHYAKFKKPGPAETPSVLPCAITNYRLNQEVVFPFSWNVDLTTTPRLDALEWLMKLLDLRAAIPFRRRKAAPPMVSDHVDLLEDSLKNLCVRSLLGCYR